MSKELENIALISTKKLLEGHIIKIVRYSTKKEMIDLGWENEDPVIVFETENGVVFYPSRDHERNSPGVLIIQHITEKTESYYQL